MKTMKNHFAMALMLSTALTLGSCGEKGGDDVGNGGATLEITPSSTDEISFAGGSITVTVETDGYWAATSDKSWVAFDPIRGQGNGTFKATFASHTATEPRTAKITVTLDDGSASKSFDITQGAIEANFTREISGVFLDYCIGIEQFSFLGPQVGMLLDFEIIAPGTLTLAFENSHIHTMLSSMEPSQYAYNSATGAISSNADVVGVPIFDGGGLLPGADFPALCPRSNPKVCTIHIDEPGTYYSCHTVEINVASCVPNDENGAPIAGAVDTEQPGGTDETFPLTEEFKLTVTFVADTE